MTREFNERMVSHARKETYKYCNDYDLNSCLQTNGGCMHDNLGMLRMYGDYEIYEWFKFWMIESYRVAKEMIKRGL